jgi:hypothetical protein
MHNVGPGIWRKKTEKCGTCEMHSAGPGIWRETLEKQENEKHTW